MHVSSERCYPPPVEEEPFLEGGRGPRAWAFSHTERQACPPAARPQKPERPPSEGLTHLRSPNGDPKEPLRSLLFWCPRAQNGWSYYFIFLGKSTRIFSNFK